MKSKLISLVLISVLLPFAEAKGQNSNQLASICSYINGSFGMESRRLTATSKAPTSPSYGKTIDSILGGMNQEVKKAFKKAWKISAAGTSSVEGLVLIFRKPDGSLQARVQNSTNEMRQVSFRWIPNILAVVHTHPNNVNPAPGGKDLLVADRFQIPVFTITDRGMFVYDPATGKIIRVMPGFSWLPDKCRENLSASVKP